MLLTACAILLAGCSNNSEYGAAEEYTPISDPSFNCYAYALGEDEWRYVGGSQDAVSNFDVNAVGEMVVNDVTQSGMGIRPLSAFDSPIEADEYRIALRTGESDYHFMRQNSDGTWSHKPSWLPTMLASGTNPSTISWDLPAFEIDANGRHQLVFIPNYYDSKTLYFAISK